jgi:hypothetical protein
MQKIFMLLLLASFTAPLWAGTQVKAHLESYAYKEAWVDVGAAIEDGRLRLDFQGPWSRGSVIYDRESSQVTIIDHLHRTILPLSQDSQAALKLIGAIATNRLQKEITASESGTRAYALVAENAQAFFNGSPDLRGSNINKEGFTCDEYQTDLQGQRAREVWVTSPEKAGVKGEDYDTFRSLAHLAMDLFGIELSQLGADPATFQEGLDNTQLPVLEVLYAKGKPSGRFKVLQIRSRDFAPGTFDPPSGYQTLSLLDLINQGGNRNP